MAKPDVSELDFSRYAQAMKIKPVCPCCQSEEWTVYVETDSSSFAVVKVKRDEPTDIEHAFLILMLLCSRCKFLAMFNRDLVAGWLADNPD